MGRLRSLTAENFKSLRNLHLELGEVTVFLGANGVGKSNIFDALRFIKDRVERGIHQALQERGGVEACAWRGLPNRAQSFSLKADFGLTLEYSLSVGLAGPGGPEQLRSTSGQRAWMETRTETLRFCDHSGNAALTVGEDGGLLNLLENREASTALKAFVEQVRGWQFYNFMPLLMRSPGPAKKEPCLDEYGRNFSSWLHGIQSGRRRTFEEIIAVLKDAIRTTRDASSELTENSEVLMILEEEGLDGHLPGSAVSDGTLRFLAHIAVLRQPAPPTLLCLEEPENYVHPRLLEQLSEEIQTAALRFPILINTHSPLLVDRFEPETIVIVERSREGTSVVPIASRSDLQKLIQEMQLELGEIWYSGALGGVESKLD